MSEKDYLTRQIVSLEKQRAHALAQAQQCEGGITVCRHRLSMLEREEGGDSQPENRLPAEALNGEG